MIRRNRLLISLLLIIFVLLSAYGLHRAFEDSPSDLGIYVSNIEKKWIDIPYADRSQNQKLDIYLPNDSPGPFPVIVHIHGGYFMYGDKADNQLIPALKGLERGYAVVSINYRLSDEAKFPSQVNDAKAAIRFIKTNAGRYNLNPDKIAVWGGSAGGYLAAAVGTTSDITKLDDLSLGNADQSSRVQAVVDWCGPADFLTINDQLSQNKASADAQKNISTSIEKLFGGTVSESQELVNTSNLAAYISPDDPPMLIQHGTDDTVVPQQQSINYATQLHSVHGKDKIELDLLYEGGHIGATFSRPNNLNRVYSFLDRYLKSTP